MHSCIHRCRYNLHKRALVLQDQQIVSQIGELHNLTRFLWMVTNESLQYLKNILSELIHRIQQPLTRNLVHQAHRLHRMVRIWYTSFAVEFSSRSLSNTFEQRYLLLHPPSVQGQSQTATLHDASFLQIKYPARYPTDPAAYPSGTPMPQFSKTALNPV